MSGIPKAGIVVPSHYAERDPRAIYAEIGEAWVALEDLYIELGRAMSERRRMATMTQAELADLVNLSRDQVALFETGKRWKHDRPGIERMVMCLCEGRNFSKKYHKQERK